MSEEIFLTIATCSKSNCSDLLETCMSVKLFTTTLPFVGFEHLLILSDYKVSEIHSVQHHLNSYDKNVITRIIQMHPKGISAAFNNALESAKGNYIIFLNAGDVLTCDSDCLASINEIISNLSSRYECLPKPIYYFDLLTTGKSKLANRRVRSPSKVNLFQFLKMGNPINHQSTIYPLKLAKKYSYPNMSIGMDYSVNLSMKLNRAVFCKLSGVLVTYDITGVSAKSPFKRLNTNLKTFLAETTKHRLFVLIVLCLLLLPFQIIKATIQKITYPLR